MSRTMMVSLVFENECDREAWLVQHGLIPPKHGDYKGVAERVDYEQRRDQLVLVFTVPAPTPGKAFVMPPLPNAEKHEQALTRLKEMSQEEFAATMKPPAAPEDRTIPYPGRFSKRRLSDLNEAELRQLHRAFRGILASPAADADTPTWLARIVEWGAHRGFRIGDAQ